MLAKVIRNLEQHPFQPEMLTIVDDMFRIIGKNTKFPFRIIIPFLLDWQDVALFLFCQFPQSATFVRTTQACTMLEGSPAPNVLPQTASVMVNYRLLPGTSLADVERHIRKVVRNKNIDVEFVSAKESTAISPTKSNAFAVLTELSQQMDEKNVVVPYIVMGRTDSFHYEAVCENIYRYSPFLVDLSLLLTTHAANERCPIEQLTKGVCFYKMYIKKMTEK
jgi:carboxypeptidase PM20D1